MPLALRLAETGLNFLHFGLHFLGFGHHGAELGEGFELIEHNNSRL